MPVIRTKYRAKFSDTFTLIVLFLFICFYSNGSNNVDYDNAQQLIKSAKNHSDLKKRVLVLNAYHEGYHWTDRIMIGVHDVFNKHNNIELFVNYIDSKRCYDSMYFDQLINIYRHKYRNVSFNAILVSDDHALDFILKYRDDVFTGVPIVFCGINDFHPNRIAGHNNITGLHESYDVKGTIDLILHLHPATKEIAVISDNTLSGQSFDNRIERAKEKLKPDLTITSLSGLSSDELSTELQTLNKQTIVLWSIYISEPNGTTYSTQESIQLVQASTSLPIYCIWDVVGKGVIGGKITDPVYQGMRSSEMVLEILKGGNADSIRIETSPLRYKFDFDALNQYDININQLPPNSLIINQPEPFKVNKNEIIAVLALIVFLGLVVIVLIYLVQKQKQAKAEVFEKNMHLEEATRLLEETNQSLSEALEIASKSKALEKANNELLKKEKALQRLNNELKTSNQTKDKFFAIIAHDLRNPFNALISISSALCEQFDDLSASEQQECLTMLDKTINNTFQLVENLLVWSSSHSGGINFKPCRFNLHEKIDETIKLLKQMAEKKSISLTRELSKDLSVTADQNMILLVIRNLISNAIKFTPRGGTVEISTRQTATPQGMETVEVSVKDNGVGISESVQTTLFDVGEVSHTKGTDRESGTGLGLILCKEFIEKHGGKLSVKSVLNQGSEFIFSLPVHAV